MNPDSGQSHWSSQNTSYQSNRTANIFARNYCRTHDSSSCRELQNFHRVQRFLRCSRCEGKTNLKGNYNWRRSFEDSQEINHGRGDRRVMCKITRRPPCTSPRPFVITDMPKSIRIKTKNETHCVVLSDFYWALQHALAAPASGVGVVRTCSEHTKTRADQCRPIKCPCSKRSCSGSD